jgi:hypothetical protein
MSIVSREVVDAQDADVVVDRRSTSFGAWRAYRASLESAGASAPSTGA